MTKTNSETSLRVKPVAGHIGAEIEGVDLRQGLSDAAVAEIRAALLQWKVIFFRKQSIDHAQQVAFAGRFGEVTFAHPLEDDPVDQDHPQVLAIDRRRYERADGRKYTYESRWHTDVTAVVNPPAASILRAVNVPAFGGDTQWTNLVAAYEGLSAPVRALADTLKAEHRFGANVSAKEWENPFLRRVSKNPLVSIHPVVRVHPETGERALFVSPGFTSHIVGVSRSESQKLLELFFEQIEKPAYTVRLRWNAGDIAFWDNRATAHLGPQDLDHLDVERVLYRVTLTGDVPVGVDGYKSEIVQGKPFGVEPSPILKRPLKGSVPSVQA
jgi:alpha-ketoglutarate-dependent sulfate ester dioxygenase